MFANGRLDMATVVMLLVKVLHTVPMERPELMPLVKPPEERQLGVVSSKVTRHADEEGVGHLLPSDLHTHMNFPGSSSMAPGVPYLHEG